MIILHELKILINYHWNEIHNKPYIIWKNLSSDTLYAVYTHASTVLAQDGITVVTAGTIHTSDPTETSTNYADYFDHTTSSGITILQNCLVLVHLHAAGAVGHGANYDIHGYIVRFRGGTQTLFAYNQNDFNVTAAQPGISLSAIVPCEIGDIIMPCIDDYRFSGSGLLFNANMSISLIVSSV